jgi:hypothetical protein
VCARFNSASSSMCRKIKFAAFDDRMLDVLKDV